MNKKYGLEFEREIREGNWSSEKCLKATSPKLEFEFSLGSIWEDNPWKIVTNHVAFIEPGEMCKHCHTPHVHVNQDAYGGTFETFQCICPRVVVGTNEGGYATTGICLDCILEAAGTLK